MSFSDRQADRVRPVVMGDDLKQQVDNIARASRRSRSFIVKEAVETYVRDRAAYIRDLDLAVKSAESGVRHSGEQVFGWMRSWGTAGETASPKPYILTKKTRAVAKLEEMPNQLFEEFKSAVAAYQFSSEELHEASAIARKSKPNAV